MAEIQDMTGFQSPCTEYAEDELSLDQFFLTDRPAMFMVEAGIHYPSFQIMKGDKMVIHRGKQPENGKTVVAVISNRFVLATFRWIDGAGYLLPFNKKVGDVEQDEDFIWGVVSSIHRKC